VSFGGRSVLAAGLLLIAGCDRARSPAAAQVAEPCVRLSDGPVSDSCSRAYFAAKARADSARGLEHQDSAPRFKDNHL